jgi:regulator of protease activity HflC (stomatin/prohibitin superfamily)
MIASLIFLGVVAFFILRTVRIVPQQSAFVVERLGQYNRTLNAGMHIVVPFVDSIRYRHSLKELVIDVPEQICITRDNVQVKVDGVLFMRVMDPAKASYGVSDHVGAVIQLAQTTLRSEMGKLELDKTFEERDYINTSVVRAIDPATDPWGVKVLRYELKSIQPPREILDAMEKQMRAEREKRAKILESEGDRDSKINRAEGDKQEIIKGSEAEKQRRINEAEGQASAIKAVANATAEGLSMVASSMNGPGGRDAAQLRVAEEYVKQFGAMAKETNTMILPANLADISGLVSAAMTVIKTQSGSQTSK